MAKFQQRERAPGVLCDRGSAAARDQLLELGDTIDIKQLGVGLAVAVLLDATLIRGVLLPAAMTLLGERNWYLPRWLTWLPRLNVEARTLGRPGRGEPVTAMD